MLNAINKFLGKSWSRTSKKLWLIVGVIALAIFLYIEADGTGDFHIFLQASKGLISGENIYERTYNDGYHYFYSLLFALIIYPLNFLPLHLAKFLWLGFNVYLLYRLFHIINKLLPVYVLQDNQKKWFWILTLLFSLRLIRENLHFGQMSILLLYLCLEGILLITNKKDYSGAFLIALGINIKLLPIVLLPYLLYRKHFKASGLVVLFYMFFFFLPIPIIGEQQFSVLIKTWGNLVNPLNSKHILDVEERSFHGLTTLLSTLFVENVPDTYALPIKRNIANLSLDQLSKVILLVRLIFVGFTIYFLRSLPFKKAKSTLHQFWEVSYLLAIIPLIFPHQQHYAFLFIAPAYMYCLFYVINYYQSLTVFKRNITIVTMIIIYLSVNLKLILGEFNDYYEHFKILTYGAILLVGLLSCLIPKSPITDT